MIEYATRLIPAGSNADKVSYQRHLERRSAATNSRQALCEYCTAPSHGRYPHPRGGTVILCEGCARQQAESERRHKSAAYRTRLAGIKSALGIR
ncbi:MAG: hypothetical protein ACLQGP_39510 [Isosphaeraceae bacterium]